MKAQELRIGNLVTIDKLMQESLHDSCEVIMKEDYIPVVSVAKDECNLLIDGDEFDFDIKDILPIPLTEEWLTKFGFLKNYSNSYTSYKLSSRGFTIEYEFRNGENVINAAMLECVGLDIDYVHQLQNLFFALTGEELEGKV